MIWNLIIVLLAVLQWLKLYWSFKTYVYWPFRFLPRNVYLEPDKWVSGLMHLPPNPGNLNTIPEIHMVKGEWAHLTFFIILEKCFQFFSIYYVGHGMIVYNFYNVELWSFYAWFIYGFLLWKGVRFY